MLVQFTDCEGDKVLVNPDYIRYVGEANDGHGNKTGEAVICIDCGNSTTRVFVKESVEDVLIVANSQEQKFYNY